MKLVRYMFVKLFGFALRWLQQQPLPGPKNLMWPTKGRQTGKQNGESGAKVWHLFNWNFWGFAAADTSVHLLRLAPGPSRAICKINFEQVGPNQRQPTIPIPIPILIPEIYAYMGDFLLVASAFDAFLLHCLIGNDL